MHFIRLLLRCNIQINQIAVQVFL